MCTRLPLKQYIFSPTPPPVPRSLRQRVAFLTAQHLCMRVPVGLREQVGAAAPPLGADRASVTSLLQTKDAVFTLSAMTSGIRRNWIEALRKNVRPVSAPDVTK